MKRWTRMILAGLFFLGAGAETTWSQSSQPNQKRIMMERGEKVQGQRLALVKRVIENYAGCQVLATGNELNGLVINGKTYQDFTIVIRDVKKTIIVVTADGVVTFDY